MARLQLGIAPARPADAARLQDLTAGGGSPANPSALVGLTAINGSANTYMRSDGAPALDQSIAPTWTGQHTWAGASGWLITLNASGSAVGLWAHTQMHSSNSAILAHTQGSGDAITVMQGNASNGPAINVLSGPTILQALTATTAAFSAKTSAALAPVTGSTDVVRLLDFGTGISAANLASAYAQTGTNTTAIAANTASINPLATGYKQGPYAPLSALAGYAPFAGVGTPNPFTVGPLSATTGFFSGAVGVGGTSASPLASINALGLGGMTATNLSLSGTGSLLQVGSAKSAWNANQIGIDVGTAGGFRADVGVGSCAIEMDSNLYYDASGYWRYKIGTAGALVCGANFTVGYGTFAWSTAVPGSAGAPAALTQVMSLSNAGVLNVAGTIGTVVPTNNGSGSPIPMLMLGTPTTTGNTLMYTCSKVTIIPSIGGVYSNGNLLTSDLRLKKELTPITKVLDFIKSLNGIKFNWIENDIPSVGLIAQEVERTFPELVDVQNDTKYLNYNGIVACLVEAVKEQQLQIEALKARLN